MPFLTVSDYTKIYYEDCGEGETILFAHGLGSNHMELKNFIDEFKSDYRCIYYDQRGHGASDKSLFHMNVKRLGQDMNDLITYLDLKNITVIGHSMGAATIFSYVNQFGCGRLKKIISVDMTPYMRNTVWEGGLVCGKQTDEDFLCDLDRIFDDYGENVKGGFTLAKDFPGTTHLILMEKPRECAECIKNFMSKGA